MFHHKDKYLKDEFGVTLTQSEEHTWEDDEGNVYSEEVERPIPNPDFNETMMKKIPSRSNVQNGTL